MIAVEQPKKALLPGFKTGSEVSSSGSTVTLFYETAFYETAFSVEYGLTGREKNERHRRTTAFKDF